MGLNNMTRIGDLHVRRNHVIEQLPCFQEAYLKLASQIFDDTDTVEINLTYLSEDEIYNQREKHKEIKKEKARD